MFSLRFHILLCAVLLWAAPAHGDILIATAGPLSGPNAALGEQLRQGVALAIDDINARGGLRGEKLALKIADDGCDPRKAVDAATAFAAEGVKLVAGHYCSGASIPASKVYEAAGIVQISPASTHPKFTDEGGWNVLRTAQRDDAQGAAAARLILRNFKDRKIALLNDGSPSGKALCETLRQTLSASGLKPLIDESYKPGAKDYSDLAFRLNAADIGVLYIGGTYVEAGLIIREMRDIGSTVQLIASDALAVDAFGELARDAAEGTLMTFMADAQDMEPAKDVAARLRAAGFNPEGFTLHAYAAVQAWVQAAEATGGTDATAIAKWLRDGNPVKTVLGDMEFDAKGDLKTQSFIWLRWRNGRYEDAADSP